MQWPFVDEILSNKHLFIYVEADLIVLWYVQYLLFGGVRELGYFLLYSTQSRFVEPKASLMSESTMQLMF